MNLVDQYRLMHEAGHFKGYSIVRHIPEICNLVNVTNAKSLLDYGCGQGESYREWPWNPHIPERERSAIHYRWGGIRPHLYDPAVPKFAKKPKGMFDGVICTDVLEHVPEEELEETLREIFAYARKFVFLSICTRDAKKHLPDGRNCHLTVKPEIWWRTLIAGLEPAVLYEVEFVE